MTDQAFAGVRVVGGLLPADLLSRLVAARDVRGVASGDFHLGAGESVREAANRSWSYLTGVWAGYRAALEQLPETDRATSLTRERWLQVLFGQLGFGRLPTTPAGGIVADGKAFAISHRWEHVPVHLLGWRVELDRKAAGVAGAADAAPQSLVQECVNRSDEHLWAMLSNGRVLRLLRDSTSLVGSAYVEFDLEAIFEGELFSDFLLLFTLCHQSRVEQLTEEGGAADCWLERWRTDALESGTRALEQLRDGVRAAIETLGTGFLQHPGNASLRDDLASGALSREDYRQALLRLVYRLLFLFVAEDRNALLDPGAPAGARARFDGYFSTARLRSLARRRRGGRHGDLWRALVLVTDGLGAEQGRPELGLPGIGGLFEPGVLDFLSERELANEALLDAVRSLCLLRERRSGKLRVVDYRNLGAEELGSVYESLLEYVPQHDPAAVTFSLALLSGNERKTTGSYYTPTSLIETLLDSALDPLLDDALKAADPREALLALTVCDPACGSGHFLVAAARRIAKRVATVDTGDPEPPPERVRAALREVVGRCIYGVDLNPLAADLAKVSLWLEAMEPGRPLAFLDAQIKVGNALLGTTPRLLAEGVPDSAFGTIEGDDKKVARALLTQNRSERSGQGDLFAAAEVEIGNLRLAEQARAVVTGPAPSLTDAHLQARRHRDLDASPELHRARLVADAWCAAFVQPKTADAAATLTHATLLALQADPDAVPEPTRRLVTDLAGRYRFFHWHLEFPHLFPVPAVPSADTNPDTGWDGGFSCILGNPPWERIKLQEQEFFAARDEAIAKAPNAAARRRLIAVLVDEHPALHAEFLAAKRRAEGESQLLRTPGRYPLTGRGDINTYALFAETAQHLLEPSGIGGQVLPTGIGTDATTAPFFAGLVRRSALVSFLEFENEAFLLSRAVDHRVRFCLLVAAGRARHVDKAQFAFGTRYMSDLWSGIFAMPPEEILLVNPNTGTVPLFRTRRDAEITFDIYRRVPVLIRERAVDGNPWQLSFMTMFHMANDSEGFHTREELQRDGWSLDGNTFGGGPERLLPLYEAKMIHHFDHRLGTYEGQTQAQANVGTLPRLTADQHDDPSWVALPRYWVAESEVDARLESRWDRRWLLAWRDICRSTDERTVIATVLPRVGLGHTSPVALCQKPPAGLAAVLTTFVLDYVARQKLGGTHLTYSYLNQLAVPAPEAYEESAPWDTYELLRVWVASRVLELSYTAHDMAEFAADLGELGPPFRWDGERRALLRAELDAAYFHLYGVERDDVDYVMTTFTVVRKRDEARSGEYRTKRLILEIYDAMATAIETGEPYQTVLDPPPGEGSRHPAAATRGS